MLEFFLGWRRKVGGLTLLIACLFLMGWVRSRTVIDLVNVWASPTTAQMLVSDRAGISWIGLIDADGDSLADTNVYLGEQSSPGGFLDDLDTEWKWQLVGIRFGVGKERVPPDWGGPGDAMSGQEQMLPTIKIPGVANFLVFPHSSVTILMTVVSAYLLLSKPGKTNRKNDIEPWARDLPSK